MNGYMTGNSARNCARCGQELTDAASMEAGIGPVCRKLDNALLARQIPPNVQAAIVAYKTVDLGQLAPAAVATFVEVEADLLAPEAATRQDWRVVVKRVEWVLSHTTSDANRKNLAAIASGLGYIGLASLWMGEAATGIAKVTFLEGRLYVKGPGLRTRKGRNALYVAFKNLNGKRHPPAQGDTQWSWSAPAAQHEGFAKAVQAHYPVNEGMEAALVAAKEYKPAPAPAPVAAPAAATPTETKEATVTKVGTVIQITTPKKYVPSEVFSKFLYELKAAVPYKARQFNWNTKAWEINPSCQAEAIAVVKKHFPTALVKVA